MTNSRDDLIRQILGLYDTIEQLRVDNLRLRGRVESYENVTPEEIVCITEMDELVLKYGREVLVKDILGYWHSVNFSEDEDTGEVGVESFEDWRKRCLKRDKIPDWCSFNGFIEYFDAELRETYRVECEKAVVEAHNER